MDIIYLIMWTKRLRQNFKNLSIACWVTLPRSFTVFVKQCSTAFGDGGMKAARAVLPLHASAWTTASEPIDIILNMTDRLEQDRLTKVWQDNSYSQLHVICITVWTICRLSSWFLSRLKLIV
jgi:hypothetical protein